jgi:pimeloyl-ACP methyl ester carboxylesterase
MDKVLPSGAAAIVRHVSVAAEKDAPLVAEPQRLSVVIFSPGAGVKTLFYSSLEMDLASHGYLVVALEHLYDAPVVVFPHGRILHSIPKKKVSDSADGERQAMQDTADYRAQDILFAKAKLGELAADAKSFFSNRLDLHRVAAVGHSLGGMAAMRACQLDAVIGACVNIDGSYRARPYPSGKPLGLRQPTMWLRRPLFVFTDAQLKGIGMTREEFNAEVSLGQQLLSSNYGGGLDVVLPHVGINHMDFSDVRLLDSAASSEERAARLLTVEMEREWVLNFIGKSLDGQPARASLIDTASRYREAHISLYGQKN